MVLVSSANWEKIKGLIEDIKMEYVSIVPGERRRYYDVDTEVIEEKIKEIEKLLVPATDER